MTANVTQIQQSDMNNDSIGNINLIEEFMNSSEDEVKIISCFKDEFCDMKFFNYGALVYLQENDDLNTFPHVSELLENYEKLFSANCFLGFLVLRLTKYYVTYNDGLVILSDNGSGEILNIFKIKNLVLMYNVTKRSNKIGSINYRVLRILKSLSYI